MTEDNINRQWTVARHPETSLDHSHFAYREQPIDPVSDGQILLRSRYLNVAPVMRMYMMENGGGFSTESLLSIGDVIHGRGVAEVVESKHPDFQVGDFVHGQLGWQSYKVSSVTPGEKIIKMQRRGVPAYYGLSALGMTGYSAYCGFVTRGAPKAGDAVLVSGAAGGVGSLVVQIAKALGCGPVIGIAGSEKKCQMIGELGADAMINYREENVAERVTELLPDGIDVYFDNVGGAILEAALDNLARDARVVLCGSISEYQQEHRTGPKNYTSLRASEADMRGFFVYNHAADFERAEVDMAGWIKAEKLRALVDISDGFESMPDALIGLYTGENLGKRLVRVMPGEDVIF
ncbi:MAG: NADP-dependent oxidoreductase [Pseudomonadota bacterium]